MLALRAGAYVSGLIAEGIAVFLRTFFWMEIKQITPISLYKCSQGFLFWFVLREAQISVQAFLAICQFRQLVYRQEMTTIRGGLPRIAELVPGNSGLGLRSLIANLIYFLSIYFQLQFSIFLTPTVNIFQERNLLQMHKICLRVMIGYSAANSYVPYIKKQHQTRTIFLVNFK